MPVHRSNPFKPEVQLAATALAIGSSLFCQAARADIYYTIKINEFDQYEIYGLNPNSQSTPQLISTITNVTVGDSASGNPNGFAFDQANQSLFFQGRDEANDFKLYGVKLGSSSAIELANLSGSVTSGAFYNNTFYSVLQNSNTLSSWDISYAGGIPSLATPNTPLTLSGIDNANYGDIAIDNNGMLYAMTSSGVFYKADLTDTPTLGVITGTVINTAFKCPTPADPMPASTCGPQLSFNSDFSTLYGLQSGTQNWYTINLTTGTGSLITQGYPGSPFVTNDLRDLAGANPVPAPLPILGAAVAFHSSRQVRKRIKLASRAIKA